MRPYVSIEGDGPDAHYSIGHSKDPSGNKKVLLQLQDNEGRQVRVNLNFSDVINIVHDLTLARGELNKDSA